MLWVTTLTMQVSGAVSPLRIKYTVDTVFHGHAYRHPVQISLWDDFVQWLLARIQDLVDAASNTPWAASVMRGTIYVLAMVIVVRIVWEGVALYRARWHDPIRSSRSGGSAAAWRRVERAERRGDYTEAAHAVYAALVETLLERGVLQTHPSKTIGDYLRDLRRSGTTTGHGGDTTMLATVFTTFAPGYEVVIYRDGICDADRYWKLRAIAAPVAPGTAAARGAIAA